MTTDDKLRDEKMQHDINREAAKVSALSSGKIDNYGYLASKKILPPDQSRMIEQAKFNYSPLGSFEKTNKNNLRPRKKEVEALEVLESRTLSQRTFPERSRKK